LKKTLVFFSFTFLRSLLKTGKKIGLKKKNHLKQQFSKKVNRLFDAAVQKNSVYDTASLSLSPFLFLSFFSLSLSLSLSLLISFYVTLHFCFHLSFCFAFFCLFFQFSASLSFCQYLCHFLIFQFPCLFIFFNFYESLSLFNISASFSFWSHYLSPPFSICVYLYPSLFPFSQL
jgi:hypothetical protein